MRGIVDCRNNISGLKNQIKVMLKDKKKRKKERKKERRKENEVKTLCNDFYPNGFR